MRACCRNQGAWFSFLDLEQLVAARLSFHKLKVLVDVTLSTISLQFLAVSAAQTRPSGSSARMVSAGLSETNPYMVRSDPQLVKRLEYLTNKVRS